jgi:ribonuclease/clavin/mitogillin
MDKFVLLELPHITRVSVFYSYVRFSLVSPLSSDQSLCGAGARPGKSYDLVFVPKLIPPVRTRDLIPYKVRHSDWLIDWLIWIARAGTNTYLLGRKPPYVLLDTGDGTPEYIPVLERALLGNDNDRLAPPPNGVYVSDVIISHKHPDHHGGLHSVLELLKRLWTRHVTPPSSTTSTSSTSITSITSITSTSTSTQTQTQTYPPPRLHKFASFSRTPDRWDTLLDASLSKITDGLVSIPPVASCGLSGTPEIRRCHRIKEGQEFILTGNDSNGNGCSTDGSSIIRAIHTPGHTDDSICLYHQEDRALFTFDSILGHGTAVFENLSQYLSSLQHLLDLLELNKAGARAETAFTTKLYPGHGPVVEDGEALIRQYITHRMEREEQLIKLFGSMSTAQGEGEGEGEGEEKTMESWTVDQLLEKVYPPHVREMARRGVLLHLSKLEVDGKVRKSQCEGVDTWTLI